MNEPQPAVTRVPRRLTDDSLQIRHLSHFQFSWVAGDAGQPGTITLQLVLDQGAWEEVLTVEASDAKVLRRLLDHNREVFYDVGRRALVFGTSPVGS